MPTKALKTFKAWSWSRLSDYERCPYFAQLKHLDKRRVPDNAAQARGSDIHAKAEGYARRRIRVLPKELRLFKEEFAALRRRSSDLQLELQVAMNQRWEVVEWYAPDAWCRVVIDLTYLDGGTREVVDHKSGNIYDDAIAQLDLYALAGFALPGTDGAVHAAFWYLDQGEIRDRAYARSEVPLLKRTWEKRVRPLLRDQRFKPRPGSYCRWCPFRKDAGGPCVY